MSSSTFIYGVSRWRIYQPILEVILKYYFQIRARLSNSQLGSSKIFRKYIYLKIKIELLTNTLFYLFRDLFGLLLKLVNLSKKIGENAN